MKQGVWLFPALLAGVWLLQATPGFRAAAVTFAGLTALVLMVCGNFLRPRRERAIPLALGMAISWAGAAIVTGWSSCAPQLDSADLIRGHPALFLCLALCMTGAMLHFADIGRMPGARVRAGLIWGTIAASAVAIAAAPL